MLLVAAVAGGSGDVSFLANLLRSLLSYVGDSCGADPLELCVCVVKQAGGIASAALLALLRAAPCLYCAASLRLLERAGDGVRAAVHEGAFGSEALALLGTPSLFSAADAPPDVVLQAPLSVFASGAAAFKAAANNTAASVLPVPLVTVREFGQARFAALQQPEALFDVDVSAGLDDDELGIFALSTPSASSSAALGAQLPMGVRAAVSAGAYCLGYFRAARHGRQLGRAVGLQLLSPQTPPLSAVFLPFADTAALGQLLRGLRTVVAHAEVVEEYEAVTGSSVAFLVIRVRPEGPLIQLELADVMGLHLQLSDFRALLASARFAAVTGDATLNEALAFGVPFFYCDEGHKAGVAASLRELAQGAPVVLAWWRLLEAKTPASFEDIGKWEAVHASFEAFSEHVMRERGSLGQRVCALVRNAARGAQ